MDEYQRPKKPYRADIDKTPRSYTGEKPAYGKPKPKPVVITPRNNTNNKVFLAAIKDNLTVKIYINNKLCTDETLIPVYEGKLKSFDDFTALLDTGNGEFLINKSAITIMEIIKNVQ